MPDFKRTLNQESADLKRKGLYRELRFIEGSQGPRVKIAGRDYLCFCSNNYLGLADHPEVRKAVIDAAGKYGWGSGASRLISGGMAPHELLEKEIARFKNAHAAILFPSGYTANLGVISSLAGPDDVVIIDRLNHASIIDGCRLSGARLRVYPHRDVERLEKILRDSSAARRRLIVTDSIFSMDGDIAPLREITDIAKRHDAWVMADEAHATGVLGKHGRGVAEMLGIEEKIDVSLGTLSKGLGGIGGFVAGPFELIEYLRNKAGSFIYTTAPPPAACAAAIAAIRILKKNPGLGKSVMENAERIRGGLGELGFDTMGSKHHIIPVLIGDPGRAVAVSEELFLRGILAPAIRPPTVPRGKSRIRLTAMATHSSRDVYRLLDAWRDIAGRQ